MFNATHIDPATFLPKIPRRLAVLSIILANLAMGWMPCTCAANEPEAAYVFPAGGRRGTTVNLRVGAHYLHEGGSFVMNGPGVDTSPRVTQTEKIWFDGPLLYKPLSTKEENYPKDYLGCVTLDDDAPLGNRYWHIGNSQGVSAGHAFVVGDLPEIVEEEIDGDPIPRQVELPVTINGRIFPREDVDIWCFTAAAGQTVTCEVVAARIGSRLDSVLQVIGPDGVPVAENIDHFGSDSKLAFVAPATGTYQVRIHDIRFLGYQDYVYRLTITAGLYVDYLFPLGGQAGTSVDFHLYGPQCPNEPIHATLAEDTYGPCLRQFDVGGVRSNSVLIGTSPFPEFVEPDPAMAPSDLERAKDVAIRPAAVLNGRILTAGEVDRWAIEVTAAETYRFELDSAKYGSPLDAIVSVKDEVGNELVEIGSTIDNPIEPRGQFIGPASGRCYLEVRDCDSTRGGSQYAYRLAIIPFGKPTFHLTLPQDALNLYRGTEAKLQVHAHRVNGHQLPIELQVENLPAGVEVVDTEIPAGADAAEITFRAEDTAPIQCARIRVLGRTKLSDQEQQFQAAEIASPPCVFRRQDLHLAVCMPTPFRISGVEYVASYAKRGTLLRRHYVLERGGFMGPVTLSLADKQIRHLQGVVGEAMTVDGETSECDYVVQIPAQLEMNRLGRVVVMATGQVEDELGQLHTVSYTSDHVNDQIIILTAPSPIGMRLSATSISARPNSQVDVHVTVNRGILPASPVSIDLIIPQHINDVSVNQVVIPIDKREGTLTVCFGPRPGPFNMPLTVRASTIDDNKDSVIAEAQVEIVPAAADAKSS